MSSSFSNLKFELIGTGEQSGAWGATTNSNIGTAIEQAIVGMATLTSSDFTANVATLTLSNTTSAQNARALCLNIAAGAVSAAGTINVPAIQKPYLIINGSSYTVTVKVSGLTGVAVPAGERTVVYNNGTDVGEQVTYLTNLDLGTALPVTSGGTGSTTSTGSGAVVLATSPTLVTPLLGTPTSGNFSSGTFTWPTFNQNTTGTAANITASSNSTLTTLSALSLPYSQLSGTIPTWNQNTTGTASNVTGTVAIANGGSGTTTAQGAMNAFAGAVTSGSYLRGNGTNVVMSTIQTADVPTLNQNTTGSAATLATGRTISITGDLAYTSPSFDGSTNVTASGTLATVNTNVGSFTNASLTVNAKGLITAASSGTSPVTSVTGTSPVTSSGGTTPAIGLASGYGDTQNPYASKTANYVLASPDGSSGVPTFRAIVASDIPTLNQNTTGTAAGLSATLAVASGGTGVTTLTGLVKGSGTSAFTAATAGTDYVAPGTATTFTAKQTFSGGAATMATTLTNALEVATISATAATGTINYDITTQSVLYYTSNASANWTVNFRASSGTSLNTAMATGESLTAVFMVTQGATAYYNNALTVDGTSVTPKWQGGSAPTSGNASGIDVYAYTIIKTGAAAFTVLASVTQFK